MYLCYLDESGAVEPNANTNHFVLVGLAIPADSWKACDQAVTQIKGQFDLLGREIHAAWMLRDYFEQARIPDFSRLSFEDRRRAVLGVRALNLARPRSNNSRTKLLKRYRKTEPYVHLARAERELCVRRVADLAASWRNAVVFFESQNKAHVPSTRAFDIAFEQIVSRFNHFLVRLGGQNGILVQDNNQTVAQRLTLSMRRYHREGTLWSNVANIVETPLFVDSQLTSMVQLADLCAYAVRRFFEKDERDLFDRIYPRVDRHEGLLVGGRHFTGRYQCRCQVCTDHGRY